MNPRARLLSSVPFPTAAQGRNQQCPTGSLPNTAQEVAGCFCHKGSCSAWCLPGHPCQAPFLSVTLSLPWCLRVSPGAGLGISICSTSCDSCHPMFPACWCPHEWHHKCLLYQLLLPALDPLQTCWRCPLLCSINKVTNEGDKPSQPQSPPWVQDAFLHHYLKKPNKTTKKPSKF